MTQHYYHNVIFFSQAMKKRHWEVISKTCGFEAMKGDVLVIDTMTLEEFAALNLERQITEIKAIIEKAEKEFKIEEHLSSFKKELVDLSFKYKVRLVLCSPATEDPRTSCSYRWNWNGTGFF